MNSLQAGQAAYNLTNGCTSSSI